MHIKRMAMLVLWGTMVFVPAVEAQVKHVEMRVEGMT